LQALLRNPLADPYVLGISSGAGLGAVISIAAGAGANFLGISAVPACAFAGAVCAMILVYNLSRSGGRLLIQSMLLAGVIVGSVLSSMLMFIVSVSEREAIHDVLWWLLGDLQVFDVGMLYVVGVVVIAGTLCTFFFARHLNAITLGEEEAHHLGVNVEADKRILFILSSLLSGSIVSACGVIGFVGLIIPHTVRLIVGPDHRILLPSAAICGAIFLVICDTVARTILLPAEVPIGVITALVGGPFFIVLLKKREIIR
jgi:iron complex transport system permease protein